MASQIVQWFSPYEPFLAAARGAAVVVALAAIGSRLIRSAAGQAAIWRIATVSMFLLLVFDLTGFGQAVAQFGRQWIASHAASEKPVTHLTRMPDKSLPILAKSESSSEVLVAPPSGAGASDIRLKPALQMPATSEVVAVPPSGDARDESRLRPALQPSQPSPVTWPVTLWIAGTALTLCWIIGGRIAAARFRQRCSMMNDSQLYERVAELRATFAIKRPVVLLCSPRTATPAVFGGRRPALVLPANFSQDFDRQQQDAILAHELAHLAAHDAGWQAASQVLCAMLWWHPLVWWSRRQLRAAHEALADEGSLIVADGPRVLAEALVALGQRLLEPQPRFGLSLGGGRFRSGQFRSGLGRRVERLLRLPQRPWRAPRRARMAFVHFSLPALVALAAIVFETAWAPSQAPITRGETTMGILSTSWRGSLLATALCSMLGNSPSPAAAQDNDPFRPQPAQPASDREAQQARFHAIREKAAALDEQGKHDEADRLRREAKEVMSNPAIVSDDPRVLFVTPDNPEQEKIMARLKEIGRKIVELESAGKHDEADQLKREAKELYGKLTPHTPPALTPPPGASPELQMLRDHYMAMQEKIEAVKNRGNEEQARAMEQEMEALRARIRQTEAIARGQSPTGGGDRDARLQHLRAAAENLKAAGCEAEAKHVMDLIGHMDAESRAKHSHDAQPKNRPGAESSIPPSFAWSVPGGYPPGYGDGGLTLVDIRDLRKQIEEMQRDMQEMREELKHARPFAPPPRGREEPDRTNNLERR